VGVGSLSDGKDVGRKLSEAGLGVLLDVFLEGDHFDYLFFEFFEILAFRQRIFSKKIIEKNLKGRKAGRKRRRGC
jgi:hypothetical protein